MPLIDTTLKNTPKFLAESPEPHEQEIWKKAYARYLHANDKSPWAAAKDRTRLDELLPILEGLDPKWRQVKPEWMVTTHKHVHRMNNFFNKWRVKTKEICAYLDDLQNQADNSLDNEKSRAVDATESDKSEDKCEQVDHTPLETVP